MMMMIMMVVVVVVVVMVMILMMLNGNDVDTGRLYDVSRKAVNNLRHGVTACSSQRQETRKS